MIHTLLVDYADHALSYTFLLLWGLAEYIAWSPQLDIHRKLRYRLIQAYILFFLIGSVASLHGY